MARAVFLQLSLEPNVWPSLNWQDILYCICKRTVYCILSEKRRTHIVKFGFLHDWWIYWLENIYTDGENPERKRIPNNINTRYQSLKRVFAAHTSSSLIRWRARSHSHSVSPEIWPSCLNNFCGTLFYAEFGFLHDWWYTFLRRVRIPA